jgi:hypothetical protein
VKTRLFSVAPDETRETYAEKLIENQAGAMTKRFESLSDERQAAAQARYLELTSWGFPPASAMAQLFAEFGI